MRKKSTIRFIAAALIAPALLFTAACSSGTSSEAEKGETSASSGEEAVGKVDKNAPFFDKLPEKIQEAGVLNIASYIGYPPFEYYEDDNTTITGIDREIADELEKQLGVVFEFHNVPFDSIVPGLAANRYDLAMSAMSDTMERKKQVDFVDYFKNGEAIMLRADNDGSITTITDLCGKTVGGIKGTTGVDQTDEQSAKCEKEGKPAIKHTIFPGQNEAVLAIQNNRVEAVVLGYSSGAYIADQSDGKLTMTKPFLTDDIFGIVFPKGSEQLMEAFQLGLTAILESGRYQEILDSYGQSDGAVEEITINAGTQ